MTESSNSFDPYQEWLEIRPEDQPPSHYRLLGIDEFESDSSVIDQAGKSRAAYLHQLAGGPNRASVQKLLNEVAKARRTLLDPEARELYDNQLREQPADSTAAVPAIQLAAVDKSPVRAQRKSANPRTTTGRKPRSKSWYDDWRIHVASASMLLLVAIVAVIYTNTRGDSRRATQVARADAPKLSVRPPVKRRQASTGKSSLAVALEASRSSPEASQEKPGNSQKKKAVEKAGQPRGRRTVQFELSDDWLDELNVVEDFSQPLEERFQLRRGSDLCRIQDQRLVIVSAKAKERFASLDANGVKLSLGEAVAIDTNLRTSLPEGMSTGIVAGPIRLRLASRKRNLQISMHDQTLGSIRPARNSRITLVVLRDPTDPSVFRWVVKAGDKNIAGRAKYTETVDKQVQVGVLLRSSKQEAEFPVWIDDLRIGRLSNPPEFKKAAMVPVNPKPEVAE